MKVSRPQFRADPDHWIREANGERVEVVDDKGEVRMVISAPQAPPNFRSMVAEAAAQKYLWVRERQEELITAWIAETGLRPSESKMVIHERHTGGVWRMEMHIERLGES